MMAEKNCLVVATFSSNPLKNLIQTLYIKKKKK